MKFILSTLLLLVFSLLALINDTQALGISDVFSAVNNVELALKAIQRLLGGVYEERLSNIRRTNFGDNLSLYFLKAEGDTGSIFQFMVDDITIVDALLEQDDHSSPKFR